MENNNTNHILEQAREFREKYHIVDEHDVTLKANFEFNNPH
jgi:hypothetical protein